MKKNILGVILLIVISAGLISGCSSNVGAASSWPGVAVNADKIVLSNTYQIFALDPQNGTKVWTYPAEADSKIQFYAPVEFADDMVIAGDYTHTLYGIDAASGLLTWKFDDAESRYVATSLYSDGFVYAPNADGKLYVLDQNGALQWTFETAGPNWSKPVADDEHVYLASMDHHIYALNRSYAATELQTSDAVWTVDLETSIVSDPLLQDGYLYVGTIAGKVFKVNAATGSIVWTFQDDTQVKSVWTKPIIVDGALFFATEDGHIFALDAATGDALWGTPLATDAQIVASGVEINGSVGFGTLTGNLVVVDKDKVTAPAISKEGSIYTAPYFVDGKLFLTYVGGEKQIYALDENGREYWSFSTED